PARRPALAHATPRRRSRQVRQLRQQRAHAPALPLADLLTAAQVEQARRAEKVCCRDRLCSPLVTLWLFLSQVLDPDHSCRAAVARVLAWRAARGLAACSANAGAYGKARGRLPEGVLARLTRATGRQPQDQAADGWRWKGQTVKRVAGTTLSRPDTAQNQKAFPHSRAQKPGVGLPLARLVVVFARAAGTALDAALGRYQGQQSGATALFHTRHQNLEPGDLLLADRYDASYGEIALAQPR